jgi:hypothetical protein
MFLQCGVCRSTGIIFTTVDLYLPKFKFEANGVSYRKFQTIHLEKPVPHWVTAFLSYVTVIAGSE